MRLYAQTPARRSRQMLADLAALALITVATVFALTVHGAIMRLADPGRKAQSAGDSLPSSLHDAGDAASKVPLIVIGSSLKKPLQAAAGAGDSLSDAGQSLQNTVRQVADLTALALIILPSAFILVLWLPPRLRWIRTSATTRRLFDGPGGADLRALTGPQRDLTAVPPPPGGLADAWRRGDEQVIAALSEVVLMRAGLRAQATERA
ncbi:hypothetical protein AB0D11_45645 [Streptomyces monashensis]|uniref:hypothetical protein n=1 Tax=Streptomyces monashensis TaxID=1678012 RepID=UPI0033E07BF0